MELSAGGMIAEKRPLRVSRIAVSSLPGGGGGHGGPDGAAAWRPGFAREVQPRARRVGSELLQHEIDHLDGILCIDRVTDLKTVCTKEEFEKRYRPMSPYAASSSS